MADDLTPAPIPVATEAALPSADPAPAAVSPAAEAVAAPEPAAPEPAAPDSPEPAAAPVEAKPEPEPASLLGEAGKPAPETPAPATPEAPEAAPEPPAAPVPVYEFQWPEGTAPVATEELKPFTDLLGESRVAPEAGQKLLELHIGEQQKLVERLQQQQDTTWRQTRQEWVDQLRNDPALGGNRFQATVQVCGQLIEQFGGSQEQKAELRQVFDLTGSGDHPALVRFLHNIGMALREGEPRPAAKPVPTLPRKADRRYAGSMNGAA